jgi:hypothetical protein
MSDEDALSIVGEKLGLYMSTELVIREVIGMGEYCRLTAKLEKFISETNRFTGKWDPVIKTWKLVPSGVAKYILWCLYDKKLAKRKYKYPRFAFAFECLDHGDDEAACSSACTRGDRILGCFKRGEVGTSEVYAYYVSNNERYTLKYNTPGRTQMLNCDVLLRNGQLSISEREEKKNIGHAFLNVEITQEDLDSYDPERLDVYLYEIFDEENYTKFKAMLIDTYWNLNNSFHVHISANRNVEQALMNIMRQVFGPFCHTQEHRYAVHYPRVILASPSIRCNYHESCVRIKIGTYHKSDLHTKDVESLGPVPRSTIVKLALDIALHMSNEVQEVKYYHY